MLEWIVISFSRDLPDPGVEPGSPALKVDSLPSEPSGKPLILKGGSNPLGVSSAGEPLVDEKIFPFSFLFHPIKSD